MSDIILTGNNLRASNWGVTLPNGEDAIYSISLSPLFIAPMGISGNMDTQLSNMNRGMASKLWSSASSGWAYFLSTSPYTIWPSDLYIHSYTISLRCLVSTTNS